MHVAWNVYELKYLKWKGRLLIKDHENSQIFEGERERWTEWTWIGRRWTGAVSSRCFWPALPVLPGSRVLSSRRSKPARPRNTMAAHWAWVSAYPIPATRYCDPSRAGEWEKERKKDYPFFVSASRHRYPPIHVIDIDLNEDLINGRRSRWSASPDKDQLKPAQGESFSRVERWPPRSNETRYYCPDREAVLLHFGSLLPRLFCVTR